MPQPRHLRRKPSAARLEEWRDWLDEAADRFERPDFLEEDPLGIPHGFGPRRTGDCRFSPQRRPGKPEEHPAVLPRPARPDGPRPGRVCPPR